MIDFLVVADIVVPVAEGTFKENEPELGGSEFRSYDGRLRSTVRWEKRSWGFSTALMLKSEGEELKEAVALNRVVAVGGSALTANCRVTIGETTIVTAITEDDNNWLMQYGVTMREA
jgi:hypothetical protein